VARLSRRWAARFIDDARLAAKLPALRQEASKAPAPRVRAGRRVSLTRLAATPKKSSKLGRGISKRLDAMAFAALEVELEGAPGERGRLLRDRGLGEETFGALEAGYAARLAIDAGLRRDFATLKAHYRDRVRRAAVTSPEPPAPPAVIVDPPTVDDLERTLEFRTVEAPASSSPVWPFASGPSKFAVPRLGDEATPARDGNTAEEPDAVLRDPLPFARSTPALTLRQHASLTVEIGLRREPIEMILARYRVTAAEKAALDFHHGAAIQADSATRDAWREACGIYLAWLTGAAPQ
jgi:hypothetical protein